MKNAVTVLLLLKRVDCNDGVASYCETLINGLNARGDRVVIASGPVTELYGYASRRKAIAKSVLDWAIIDDLKLSRPRTKVIRQIFTINRRYSVDVISPQGLSLLPLTFLLSKFSRRPVVANYHPSMVGSAASKVTTTRSFKTKLSYRILVTMFGPDRLIAISKDILEFYMRDCGAHEDRIAYFVNGVDTVAYRAASSGEREDARKSWAVLEDYLACALSGRLNFVKGHDIVVDAIRMLRCEWPELKPICLFPGAGDQAAEIQAYALKDEHDKAVFDFLSFVSGVAAIRSIYWAADIALLPSRFEGYGLVVAEAMSCGCVPIRTPSGDWQDQITDESNGFLVPFNDPQALADRIAELSHPGILARMRENAINYTQLNFSQEKMIASTSELYRSVAS